MKTLLLALGVVLISASLTLADTEVSTCGTTAKGKVFLSAERFRELMEKALHCGQQTDDELWSWKDRFAEFQNGRYFPDYFQEFGKFPQGPG